MHGLTFLVLYIFINFFSFFNFATGAVYRQWVIYCLLVPNSRTRLVNEHTYMYTHISCVHIRRMVLTYRFEISKSGDAILNCYETHTRTFEEEEVNGVDNEG